MTNHEEQYWRVLAVQAQEQAAREYHFARHYDGHIGRAFQGIAYETHLKALARLGWAEVERTSQATIGRVLREPRAQVLIIDYDPGSLDRSHMRERWTLRRKDK